MLMIQRRSGNPYLLPEGSVVLFYGTAAEVPSGWAIESKGAYVMGSNLAEIVDTILGSTSHNHTVPTTSSRSNHTHTVSSSSGAPSATKTVGSNYIHDNFARYDHTHGRSGSSSAAGGHSHSTSNTNSSSHHPPYRRLYWIKAAVDADLPVGGIVLLYGAASVLEDEMKIANGSNGTPDMRGRFVYGAVVDGDVDISGGASSHTHSSPNTGSVGSHSHTIYLTLTASSGHYSLEVYTNKASKHGHTHSGSRASGSSGGHAHSIGSSGSSGHIPPYIKLHFAMRTA